MNRTRLLRDIGQSLWLDNITRELLDNGGLRKYIDEFSITGLTSNPTIFDEAIGGGNAYDDGIRAKTKAGKSGEALFIELALEDLTQAAALFGPARGALVSAAESYLAGRWNRAAVVTVGGTGRDRGRGRACEVPLSSQGIRDLEVFLEDSAS